MTVRLRTEPDWLIVEVADNGSGLADDVLPQVFHRFYKADTARTLSEGSGLGLAIAWENARLHRAGHGWQPGRGQPPRWRRAVHPPTAGDRGASMRGWLLLVLLALVCVGCGVRPSGAIGGNPAPTGPVNGVTLFLVQQGQLAPVLRTTTTRLTPTEAVTLLAAGPSQAEQAQGLRTQVPTTSRRSA